MLLLAGDEIRFPVLGDLLLLALDDSLPLAGDEILALVVGERTLLVADAETLVPGDELLVQLLAVDDETLALVVALLAQLLVAAAEILVRLLVLVVALLAPAVPVRPDQLPAHSQACSELATRTPSRSILAFENLLSFHPPLFIREATVVKRVTKSLVAFRGSTKAKSEPIKNRQVGPALTAYFFNIIVRNYYCGVVGASLNGRESTGISRMKVVPLSNALSRPKLPPCASATARTKGRPIPQPFLLL